jgi:hypothetical protein
MDRDSLFGPPPVAADRDWDEYCSAGSSSMQAEYRTIGEHLRSLESRRASLGEPAYHAGRESMFQRRSALDEKWQKLKEECAAQRLDIGGVDGDQPPGRMPPRNAEEAAADARDRAVSRLAAERVEAAVADREAWARDKPLETSLPSEVLTAIISAGGSAAVSLARGAAGRAAASTTGSVLDDLAGAGGSSADDVITGAVDDVIDGTADDVIAAAADDAIAGAADDVANAVPGAWNNYGGQVADDCVRSSTALLDELTTNLPPGSALPAPTDATVGLPWGSIAPPQHAVLRYADGTTIDRTIIHNLESAAHAAGQPLPHAVEAYRGVDTFSPEAHRQLMDYYVALWNARWL